MQNHAKPSQTTHNYYWEHIESFKLDFKKSFREERRKKEDESSIKSRLNKRQALEATNNIKRLFDRI